ncbi:hypothetical protein QYE76_055347 [Lolium multiflorum]|uniref:Reverse transcriptase zinc-binding domain-containing protein n=1 Tax=Lolium multiflorum TaxID=4521 RepID=A0AAD8T181_LOLMU|nr:hypothetical protein QYE76_055347 [Lolium multiflorum]
MLTGALCRGGEASVASSLVVAAEVSVDLPLLFRDQPPHSSGANASAYASSGSFFTTVNVRMVIKMLVIFVLVLMAFCAWLVTLGNGTSTAFWMDLWLGDQPLHERFPNLFSHSIRPHINVATTLSSGLRSTLGPRLTVVAADDLRALSHELSLVDLHLDVSGLRETRLSNKKLSNKCFYVHSFRHLQIDDMETVIWRSAAPLKCKIFCWLARKKRLPTNERRFRHHLTTSAACLSCNTDEDNDHMLLFCSRATEVWDFFHRGFDPSDYSSLSDLCLKNSCTYEEATINGVVESLSFVTRKCIQDIRASPAASPKPSPKPRRRGLGT